MSHSVEELFAVCVPSHAPSFSSLLHVAAENCGGIWERPGQNGSLRQRARSELFILLTQSRVARAPVHEAENA